MPKHSSPSPDKQSYSFLNALHRGTSIIQSHLPAFISLEILFHTTIILSMISAHYHPELHKSISASTQSQLDNSTFGRLALAAYDKQSGSIFPAATLTFIINTFAGALLYITVPSFALPFVGLPLLGVRGVMWGLLFPLFGKGSSGWHYLTLAVEGQAYVIAALGCWLQSGDIVRQVIGGRKEGRWLRPWELRWRYGWEVTKGLYPLILSVLGVAAVWEVIEVIHLT